METKVVKPEETRIFMEGQEVDREYELKAGMAQIIPPTMPHQLTTIGDCKCIVSWSLAPGE